MSKFSITVNDCDIIASKLNNSSDEIENTWKGLKEVKLNKVRDSWAGKDCELYLQKILDLDTEITNALRAQRLLADAFKRTKEQTIETQEAINSQVSNL